jgi:Outer membrane protein beta-barrel domain
LTFDAGESAEASALRFLRIQNWHLNGARLQGPSKLALFFFVCTGLGMAQLPTSGNAFVGYSYSGARVFAPGSNSGINANGWEGSVEGKFFPWIGVVADLDWHYGGHDFTACTPAPCIPRIVTVNASRHDLLFGPRASISRGRYTPFAELLLGLMHQTDSGGGISNSDTGFAFAVGGGVDYKLIKGVAARVQLDSIHNSLFGRSQSNLRISTGVVFKF